MGKKNLGYEDVFAFQEFHMNASEDIIWEDSSGQVKSRECKYKRVSMIAEIKGISK